jgi:hypothetical protein
VKLLYKNPNPDTGVRTYELIEDAIILEFANRKFRYVYNAENPGRIHVDAMKKLARQGRGLSTYVNQHVRENYAKKLPL